MTDPSTALLTDCALRMRETYPDRLEKGLAALPPEDLWWRPHEESTSVGTLLRHLAGNVRQWIISGVGGAADVRERAAEFAGEGEEDVATLMARLRETVDEAATVIAAIPPERLMEPCTIQGFTTMPLLAVLHIAEHFSWHTGQVLWVAKMRAGPAHGVALYDEDAINRARNLPADASPDTP